MDEREAVRKWLELMERQAKALERIVDQLEDLNHKMHLLEAKIA